MSGWPPCGVPPALDAGALHLWWVNLDALRGRLDAWRAWLSPDERARAARFHFDRDAGRFVLARSILRLLLARYLDSDPAAVAIEYGEHGKPRLAAGAGPAFNVSHTGGIALLAFTPNVAIGVDIERVQQPPDLADVMRSHFAPQERAAIEAVPAAERLAAFYRCWTRKEAVLKALGWGLARPLDSFEVSIGEPRLLRMDGEPDVATWRMQAFEPVEGFAAAAAWRGLPLEARCWSFAE